MYKIGSWFRTIHPVFIWESEMKHLTAAASYFEDGSINMLSICDYIYIYVISPVQFRKGNSVFKLKAAIASKPSLMQLKPDRLMKIIVFDEPLFKISVEAYNFSPPQIYTLTHLTGYDPLYLLNGIGLTIRMRYIWISAWPKFSIQIRLQLWFLKWEEIIPFSTWWLTFMPKKVNLFFIYQKQNEYYFFFFFLSRLTERC